MIEIDTNIERIWLLIYLIINLFDLLLIKPEKLQNEKQS